MTEWNLKKNQKYKITISLGLLEGLAPNNLIAKKFTQNGFEDVEAIGEGGNRIVTGTWPNDDITFSDEHVKAVEPSNG